MVTSNPADYHHFDHLGWLAPGYQADVFALTTSSRRARPRLAGGTTRGHERHRRARGGAVGAGAGVDACTRCTSLTRPRPADFDRQPPPGGALGSSGSRSIRSRPATLVLDVTDPRSRWRRSRSSNAIGATGRIGLGYVHGFGLKRGAIASTVAHDAHNCMVVGAIDAAGPADMAAAVARLAEIGGGQVAVLDGRVLAEVALPIGGLMSFDRCCGGGGPGRPSRPRCRRAPSDVTVNAPFMQLSFLGLSVLPELRLTDLGLVDVMSFSLSDVAVP